MPEFSQEPNKNFLHEWASDFVNSIEKKYKTAAQKRTEDVTPKLTKVLKAFQKEKVGTHHFSSVTGLGHCDLGRDIIDKVYADIFGAEKAVIRMQFVSGTHAISSAFFGSLRPGNSLLSITGEPYDTLEEVIGKRGFNQGSLIDFGILYDEISIFNKGQLDFTSLEKSLEKPRTMVFIQRSCGYSWRPSLSIKQIEEICLIIHDKQPDCICFVDNCYGEFVEECEPTHVGADLIAGSLIKNPGGTIVPSGGYVAGRSDLVENACSRLTAPGIGVNSGSSFNLNRLILQGLFLAPQMVSESLIGADLVAGTFHQLGFDVQPLPGTRRSDLIQAVHIGDPKILEEICKILQFMSPVDSYINPVPGEIAGYESDLIMAGGTFVDGSTSEFSADAPLREPYNLYIQGGTHRSHIKIALIQVIASLVNAGFIALPQTS